MFIHSWSKMPLKLAWNFVHRHVWRHITRICTSMLSGYWFKSQGDIINCVYKLFSTQSWCYLQRKLMIKAKKRHIGKWDVKRSQKSGTVFREFPNCILGWKWNTCMISVFVVSNLSLHWLGNFSCFCSHLTFSTKKSFQDYNQCLTVWILICVQTVCNG